MHIKSITPFPIKEGKEETRSSVTCPNNGVKYLLPGMCNFQYFMSQQDRKKKGREDGREGRTEGRRKGRRKEINCILEKKY